MYGEALSRLDLWLKPADAESGWAVWYILLRGPRPLLIGTCGFKGPPDAGGRVEIGYGIVESQQRRGLASEATNALTEHAFSRGVRAVLAHTFERLTTSVRVLEKCGFRMVGPGFEEVPEEERRGLGELLLFERTRDPAAPLVSS